MPASFLSYTEVALNWLRMDFKPRVYRSLLGLGLFALVVLFTATRVTAAVPHTPWPEALKTAASQWIVWLLAAVVIVFLDQHFPVSKQSLLPRLLCHIPFSIVIPVFTTYLSVILVHLVVTGSAQFPELQQVLRESWQSGFFTHVMIYWAIAGLYVAYDYHRRLVERQIKSAELERLVAQSQLLALRSQLHPHFLFNSLNAISAHIESNPRVARRMLEQLGTLLRLSLDSSNDQEISLDREITFIRHYLDLQQSRFVERLEADIDLEPGILDALVPAFILQPLVENAIRHGMSTHLNHSRIEVSAWTSPGKLHLAVIDDGPGLPAGWDLERNSGIGISNTRARLRCLYGEAGYSFDISPGHREIGVRVTLSCPLRRDATFQTNSGKTHDTPSHANR